MNKIFQRMVIVFLILNIVWYVMPYCWPYIYQADQLDLLAWGGYKSYINIYGVIPYIIGVLYLLACGGLLFFKKWARTLLMVLTVLSVLPVWGVHVVPALDASIGFVLVILQGVILTLAYISSISKDFN